MNVIELNIFDKISNIFNFQINLELLILSFKDNFLDAWLNGIKTISDSTFNFITFGDDYPITFDPDSTFSYSILPGDSTQIIDPDTIELKNSGFFFNFNQGDEANSGFIIDPLDIQNIIYINDKGYEPKEII